MEANRTVFKISGSIGPAGAFVILAEKLCRAIWYDAYEQEDPKKAPTEKFAAIAKQQRGDYVSELFQVRSRLEREMDSLNEKTRQGAYGELREIIQRHARIISRTEKTRLMQKRMWYKSDPAKYQRCLDEAKLVTNDTLDNLTKMAIHIVAGTDSEKIGLSLDQLGGDIETGNIEERVTERRANELLIEWKKLLLKAEQEVVGAGQSQKLIVTIDQRKIDELKSRLFQITGEDTYDTFKAFEHYGLNQQLTAVDRHKYQK